ncbi:hypothetical protein C2G38_2036565 [Gigaspora rosea]|uniref:Uncharacterized protein n=1 Tax=Gigaspora rosea TaxID=44941 RepID=A0A397VD00_9GLOM|nr:hypothetical protein C2G38_2036565 [Gigaspora rosea]
MVVTCFKKRSTFHKFPLESEWALKSRQKYGKKGTRKHISKKIWNFLEGYFLEDDIDKSKRFTTTSMLECLKSKVDERELDENEIPKLQTIQVWIARYLEQHHQKMSEKSIEASSNSHDRRNTNTIDQSSKNLIAKYLVRNKNK